MRCIECHKDLAIAVTCEQFDDDVEIEVLCEDCTYKSRIEVTISFGWDAVHRDALEQCAGRVYESLHPGKSWLEVPESKRYDAIRALRGH